MTYYSFYYASTTVMNFFGSLLGAQFITRTEGQILSILGIRFAPVQLLMLIQALGVAAIVGVFTVLRKPMDEEEKILTKI